MILQQFNNQSFDVGIASGERLALFGLEGDVLDSLHLGGRAGETALFQVAIHIGHAPFGDVQVGQLVVQLGIGQSGTFLGDGCFLLSTECTLVLHHQLGIARTAGGCASVNGDDDGQSQHYGTGKGTELDGILLSGEQILKMKKVSKCCFTVTFHSSLFQPSLNIVYPAHPTSTNTFLF